jgi:hypothetical protein
MARRNRKTARLSGALGALVLLLAPAPGSAEEPRRASEPRLFAEPAEITQVVDALDGDDPFDLDVRFGFLQSWRSATVRRESAVQQGGAPASGLASHTVKVAEFTEQTSRLNVRADVGLLPDLALVLRLPIILSNERELLGTAGSEAVQSTTLAGLPGEQLFRIPFKSPTRSGIEYLALGLDVGLMNQTRNPSRPTWVFGVEGRFNVSEPMRACNKEPTPLNLTNQQVRCAQPSDVNRNGISGDVEDAGVELEGSFSSARRAGVSRGTTGLEVHTYLSKRVKYVEPYGGLTALSEFGSASSNYGASKGLNAALVGRPPLRGSMLFGLAVMPWEVRQDYQRVTFDFRATGSYVSEGRDYSELFDALGSSDAPSLRNPNFAEYRVNPDFPGTSTNPSIVDTGSTRVYFDGLTNVQQYTELRLTSEFTWQPGRYVKFNLGGGFTLTQSHFITFEQACADEGGLTVGQAGPCRRDSGSSFTATGLPNPHFRRVINDPGQRFLVDAGRGFDGWLNVILML